MALFKMSPLTGINKDLAASNLPLGSVTDAGNVRFREGSAELWLGQADAYPTAPIAPISAFPITIGSTRYWIVLSQTKGYCVTGSTATWTNITRQTASVDVNYAATMETCWNGGIFNGVPILNNGVDLPQMWSPVGTGTKLQALSNWPATATAKVFRPFLNYMFALNVTKAGTNYPYRVKWSHPADPGTVPASWDETDATKDAGEFDLSGPGFVLDALTLRQAFIIYKENSTFVCTYSGAPFIFNFQPLFSSSGILSADCVVEVEGTHVVLTSNDVVRHDGSQINSILDKVTRRWLFQNIDPTYYERCFVTKNIYFNEVWVCFPSVGNTSCNKALVYNYKDGSTSFRDLPNVTSGNTGLVDTSASNTIDSRTLPIDTYTRPIDENEFGAQLERTLLCSPGRPALALMDSGNQDFGSFISGYIERSGLSFDAPNQIKTLTRIRPRFNAPIGSIFTFYIGSHMEIDDPVVWSSAITYTQGTSHSVNGFVSGRYLAYRIESSSVTSWRLTGLDFDFQARGDW